MATAEEIAASNERIKQFLMKQQGINNPENVTKVEDVSTAKPSEGASKDKGGGLVDTIAQAASAALNPLAAAANAVIPGGIQGADNAMRVAAGGLGDTVAGTATGLSKALNVDVTQPSMGAKIYAALGSIPDNIREEAQKTSKARIQMFLDSGSKLPGDIVSIAGEVGGILAAPESLFATPGRAMLTGGGMGVINTGIEKLREGEPLLERPSDYAIAGGLDAAAGGAGYYLGKMMTNVLAKFGVGDKTLTDTAERLLTNNKAVVDSSLAAMDASGVQLNKIGLNALQQKVTQDLGGPLMTARLTPHALPAFNEIANVVKAGEPISLRALNDIRDRVMRDAVFDSTGLAKDTAQMTDISAVHKIGQSIDDFIKSLPMRRNNMMKGGDINKGLKAWNTMQEFNQYVFRNDKIMTLVAKADSIAREGKDSFEDALQNQFAKFYAKNRTQIKQWFDTAQQNAIKKIADGDKSKRAFNILDRWMGGTLFAPVTRLGKSVYGAMFENAESRYAASKLLHSTANAELPAIPRIATKVGVATVVPPMDKSISSK